MPLVLLAIRSGKYSAKSENGSPYQLGVSAATPFTLCEPTKARLAMRTRRSPCSSISDTSAMIVGASGSRAIASDAAVDLVDDLHVPRQQAFDQRHRPGFQRFRQQRVVGVADGARVICQASSQGRCARRPACASARRPRWPGGYR